MNWTKCFKHVVRLVDELRGKPCRQIQCYPPSKKSILTSPSFSGPVNDLKTLQEALTTHLVRCAEKLRKQRSAAKIVTVYLQTNPFKTKEPQYFNSQTAALPHSSCSTPELFWYALCLLEAIYKPAYHYKRVGVMLSGFVLEEYQQQNLFSDLPDEQLCKVSKTIDQLNEKYRRDKIRFAAQRFSEHWKPCSKH